MAIPQAVQQAADQAEALQAQLYAESQADPAEAEVQTVPPEVVADPAPSNVVALPTVADPAPVETPRPAEQSDDAKFWKQKFDSLQGKFNAEVPQLHQQLREQSAALVKLTEQVAARAETPPQDDARDGQDADNYGAELMAVVDRRAEAKARQLVQQEIAKLRQEFGTVQEQVGQVASHVAMTAEEKFWGDVMTLVPDWRSIDADPRWISWLDSVPEFAEDTYRSMAAKAIQKGDALKIANLVKLYRGFAAPPSAPEPTPPAVNPELLRQVAPSTSRASSPAQPAGRIWSAAEYTAAMDVRNIQRVGKAEADRLEAEANLAVAEGRVRW